MQDKLRYLWAKKNRDNDNNFIWLPLLIHLNDTKETMAFLWEHFLSQGVRDYLINSMDTDVSEKEILAKKLAMFLGTVHDIGKASPYFQLKHSLRTIKN